MVGHLTEGVQASIEIGTSGWHYGHWKGVFYPPALPTSAWLAFYAERFQSVEINNSFYQLPSEATFRQWYATAPAGFTFAVKASRFITHMKKLTDPQTSTALFFERVSLLGEKLGPILFQLPPHWRANPERLDTFLKVLPDRHRYAFEFRDPDWLRPEVYAVLKHYNAALCIYHLNRRTAPLELTADFVYVRLHGPGGPYQGSYSEAELEGWAQAMSGWAAERKAIYGYFDNDTAGYAPQNALTLERLLANHGLGTPSLN